MLILLCLYNFIQFFTVFLNIKTYIFLYPLATYNESIIKTRSRQHRRKKHSIIKVDCLYTILLHSQRSKTLQLDLHFIVMCKRSTANVERDMEP